MDELEHGNVLEVLFLLEAVDLLDSFLILPRAPKLRIPLVLVNLPVYGVVVDIENALYCKTCQIKTASNSNI
jgi:hypothetical protein